LLDATLANDVKLTRTLLQAGVDPNVRNADGCPILVRLLGSVPRKIVKLLIEHGVDVNAPDKKNEFTPLMVGAMHQNVKLVQQLIPHAELNLKTKEGKTLLMDLDHLKSNDNKAMAIAWIFDQEAKKRAQKE
jgi:ankyrin repeat protein